MARGSVHVHNPTTTRRLCILGLALGWFIGTPCVATGSYFLTVSQNAIELPNLARELIPLGINALITLLNESMGFIHMTSLRWALQRERRLTFNSNLRLFTSARTLKPNKWYSNILVLLCLVLSYAASSLLFLADDRPSIETYSPKTRVSGFALLILRISLCGQALVTTCCLLSKASIPTWSSSPLNAAAACLALPQGQLMHRPGRCMPAVHDGSITSEPLYPQAKQKSMYRAHKEVRRIVFFPWIMVALGILWAGTIMGLITKSPDRTGYNSGDNCGFFPVRGSSFNSSGEYGLSDTGTMSLLIFAGEECAYIPGKCPIDVTFAAWSLFLVAGLQATLTIGLHCSELSVNASRDERTWRTASRKGINPKYNSITAALKSWGNHDAVCSQNSHTLDLRFVRICLTW